MKCFILLFIALVMMMSLAQSQPISNEEGHNRQKRATCDLLSEFNVNHTFCAAHCIAKGYRGGYCDSRAICHCR